MEKISQKQLIEQIKQLKEIKPRREWAVLLKSQILSEEKQVAGVTAKSVGIGIMDAISLVFAQRKLAYAFTVVLFLIVGVFGFARYTVPGDLLFPIKKITEQSQAALTGQSGVQQDIVALSNRINDLAQVAKDGRTNSIPLAISEINANVSQLTKNLKDNPVSDQNTMKEISNSLKTLADVTGTDLSENQDIIDLYQTVVQSQIADLHKTTLSEDKIAILDEAKELYFLGRYFEALEKILLINQ